MNSVLDDGVAAAFPVLQTIEWSEPQEESEGFWYNPLNTRTRQSYLSPQLVETAKRIVVDEAMFEWVTIVETIKAAGDDYVMVDLGAGYGRWIVNAVILARRLGRTPLVIGVEAEDTHFLWMKKHLCDNRVSKEECRLLHAPISGSRRDVPFTMGHANEWYGQAVLSSPDYGFGDWPRAKVEMRRSIVLEDVIGNLPLIDLLDLDIQGMEHEVILSSIELIGQRVKQLYIGTHGKQIEDGLRKLMVAQGWISRFDFPCATTDYPTPAGPVDFQDGVQSWINPRFMDVKNPSSAQDKNSLSCS